MEKQGNALQLVNAHTKYSHYTGKRFCSEGLLWCKWDLHSKPSTHPSLSGIQYFGFKGFCSKILKKPQAETFLFRQDTPNTKLVALEWL